MIRNGLFAIIVVLSSLGSRAYGANLEIISGWQPTRIEIPSHVDWNGTAYGSVEDPNIIHFQNGQRFETFLYEVKIIGSLKRRDRAPFLIISGRSCSQCDANLSIYIHSPSDGPMKGEGKGQKHYTYPGKEFHYENRELLLHHRTFFGECLAGFGNAVVWFQSDFKEKKERKSVFVVYVEDDNLGEKWIKSSLPDIRYTLNMVRTGKCSEIKGIDRASEP